MARNIDDRFETGRASVSDGDTRDTKTPVMPGKGEPHPTAELPAVAGAVEEEDTGTGWPDDGDDAGGPVAVKSRPRTREDAPPAARGGGFLRGLFWLVAIIAVIVALVLGTRAIGWWPHLKNPFGAKTTDRSQPVLLKSIQDLSRYVAAEGNFQVVIDLQNDRKYVPDILLNDRTLFVAAGSVEAYVDFTSIGQGAITDSPDHKTATIKLPAPALGKPNIDHDKSYVFAQQKGLFNIVGDLFNGDPNKQQQLYLLGEQRIADAAKDSELPQRAQENTRKMLEGMLRALGYTSITITFAAP
jgi:hypothetical protein